MYKSIHVSHQLTERYDIRSGTIKRVTPEGNATPNYGVIFSTSSPNSPDDFDPEELLGSIVESVDLRGEEEDRFFKILGGYYMKRTFNGSKKAVISHLFGIVVEGEEGFAFLKEGGNNILADQWDHKFPPPPGIELKDGAKNFLDELNLGAEGWTFIVEPKDDNHKYPQSGKEIALWAVCPEIEAIGVVIGDCVKDQSSGILKRKVDFHIETNGVEIEEWKMDFGNGNYETGQGLPPGIISHLYETKPEKAPKITLTSSKTSCGIYEKEVALSIFEDFEICRDCAKISKVVISYGPCVPEGDLKKRQVTFDVSLQGEAPERWAWDWGDGSQETGNGMPQKKFVHHYLNKPANHPKFSIWGGTSCEDDSKEVPLDGFVKCNNCPEIKELEIVSVDYISDTEAKVQVTAHQKGKSPERYIWDWGDGNKSESTTPYAEHVYIRPKGSSKEFNITLLTEGPEGCKDSAKTKVNIQKYVSPDPPGGKLCRLFLYIVPFLFSLLIGTLVVCYVAAVVENNQEVVEQLQLQSGIIFIFIVLALFFWFKVCSPKKCDWLHIGWAVMLASTIVSIYLHACCSMAIAIFIFALLAVIFFILAYRQCWKDSKVNLVYLVGVVLLAVIISCAGIANSYLYCV